MSDSHELGASLRKLEERVISSLANRQHDKLERRLDALEKDFQQIPVIADRESRVMNDITRLDGKIDKQTDTLTKTTERIHDRIDVQEASHKVVDEVVKAAETRNRTIASVLSIVWFVIGGFASWAFKASEDKVKQYTDKVDVLERANADTKRLLNDLEAIAAQSAGLKRRLENVEIQLDNLPKDTNPRHAR